MKDKRAYFRFYEELNDFLPPELRKVTFAHDFRDSPGIKDPIETLGVPHTEVELIIVKGRSVGFDYQLRDGDRVSVYPMFEAFDVGSLVKLRPKPLRRTAFIADVNLGRLARYLRLLGFDCLYSNCYADTQVVQKSVEENRIILTRDRRLLYAREVTHGTFVRSDRPVEQVREVTARYQLERHIKPFNRCLDCNGLIRAVEKEAVEERLLPGTRRYYDEFFQCERCRKIYWKGPHFHRMQGRMRELIGTGRIG